MIFWKKEILSITFTHISMPMFNIQECLNGDITEAIHITILELSFWNKNTTIISNRRWDFEFFPPSNHFFFFLSNKANDQLDQLLWQSKQLCLVLNGRQIFFLWNSKKLNKLLLHVICNSVLGAWCIKMDFSCGFSNDPFCPQLL